MIKKQRTTTPTRVRLDFPGQPLTRDATLIVTTDIHVNQTLDGSTQEVEGLVETTVVLNAPLPFDLNGKIVPCTDLTSGKTWRVFGTDGRQLVNAAA